MRRNDQSTLRLMQLPNDVLKHILLLLAMSSDGAKDIARLLSVCRGLKKLALSKEILVAIHFAQLPSGDAFWRAKGLFMKSARARNLKPYRAIMKTIKEKIDPAHERLDEAFSLIKEYNKRVESAELSSMLSEEIISLKLSVIRIVRRNTAEVLRAESMINAFGRKYFRQQNLLVRFYCLKQKHLKCSEFLA